MLERGDIRLLSLHWLLHGQASRIARRQDLEAGAFVPSAVAARALRRYTSHSTRAQASHRPTMLCPSPLRRGERRVLALTYGWRSARDPDPLGDVLADLRSFVRAFATSHNLTKQELHEWGLFWDCAPDALDIHALDP